MKETDDLKLNIETYQNITNDKPKDTWKSIDKIKETFKREIEKVKKKNEDNNNKLRILEDRSRQIIYVLMALKNGKKNLE